MSSTEPDRELAHAASGRSQHSLRLIVTIGLYGSASTWAFNVVRELMLARYGAARVHSLYSDEVAKVMEDRQVLGRYLVWKMHFGDPQWDVLAQLADPSVLLTVRDPRDATLSLVNRFGTELPAAANAVARCCNRVLQGAIAGFPVLRYENGFFRDPATVRRIATYIGIEADDATVGTIFDRYATESVRTFAGNLEDLPPEQLKGDFATDRYDDVTQIHRGHIGDGSSGKWRRQLDEAEQRSLTAYFATFLRRFRYE